MQAQLLCQYLIAPTVIPQLTLKTFATPLRTAACANNPWPLHDPCRSWPPAPGWALQCSSWTWWSTVTGASFSAPWAKHQLNRDHPAAPCSRSQSVTEKGASPESNQGLRRLIYRWRLATAEFLDHLSDLCRRWAGLLNPQALPPQ